MFLPLFWQVVAAGNCRSVGIASPSLVAHTRDMVKPLLILLWLLFSALTQAQSPGQTGVTLSVNKQSFITQAKAWVAQQEQTKPDQIEIAAMDRRLRIPDCQEAFLVSFPYRSSKQTIRVQCIESGWQAFVGVKIHADVRGYSFIRDLPAGHIVRPEDVQETSVGRPVSGLIESLEHLGRDSLASPVSRGELVSKRHLVENTTVFKLRRDILAGETISRADVVPVAMAMNRTSDNQRFSGRLLESAIAAHDLRAGQLLSRQHLRIKRRVIMSKTTLTRGQKLNGSNTAMQDYYGELPDDALVSSIGIERMEVIRTIRAGQLLRASDLKSAAMINKGDTVKLQIDVGMLTISVSMVALENGMLDQQVTLLNPESNERVRAIVSGPGQAKGL
jgi:flagella basal body P-ring formation protein FlgA|tara:strand:- start:2371 stop:3540 length:1170 start_codon:yes stop_codon:yes gene_type:complete